MVRMSGLSPPDDPSSTSRSRSSPEESRNNPTATRVPAVSTVLVPRRTNLPSSRDAIRVEESSDTSMETSHIRFRQRGPYGPNPSNSPDPDNPVDLSATQATFLAGAAITHAHHAATIADHASNVAIQSQLETQQARFALAQQQSDFRQVAAAMRDAATAAILHNQEEAQVALAERDRDSELFEHNLNQQAQQLVLGARQHAQYEIATSQAALHREAQNFVESSVRPLQHQINVGNQQLAARNSEVAERDLRIAHLEQQLAEARQQQAAALSSPVPETPPSTVSNLMDLLADPPQAETGRNINVGNVDDQFDLFEDYHPDMHTPEVRNRPFGSPHSPTVPLQEVANPAVAESSTWAAPRVSVGQPQNEAAQNVAESMPQSFCPPGFPPMPVATSPQSTELVSIPNLPMQNAMVPSVHTVSGSNLPTDPALVQQLLSEATRLINVLQAQQQQLQQQQQTTPQQQLVAQATEGTTLHTPKGCCT